MSTMIVSLYSVSVLIENNIWIGMAKCWYTRAYDKAHMHVSLFLTGRNELRDYDKMRYLPINFVPHPLCLCSADNVTIDCEMHHGTRQLSRRHMKSYIWRVNHQFYTRGYGPCRSYAYWRSWSLFPSILLYKLLCVEIHYIAPQGGIHSLEYYTI